MKNDERHLGLQLQNITSMQKLLRIIIFQNIFIIFGIFNSHCLFSLFTQYALLLWYYYS